MNDSPRRRLQFSIRAAMVFLTIAAGVFAIFGNHLRRLNAQERAFVEIGLRGGAIYVYDESVHIDFQGSALMCGTELKRQIGPSGSSQNFTDAELHYLRSIVDLVSLDLRNTSVSQSAVEKLRCDLQGCEVTN